MIEGALSGMDPADREMVDRILALYLETRFKSPRPEELPERLTETVDALGVCLRRASAIAHGLPPARIESNELASALDALVETTGERFGVPCTSVLRGEVPPMPDEVSTQFYWIARECLLNAARHARAERIVLHLRGEDHRLRLRVMDDGQGFEPAGDGDGGMGLRILEHRADRIGAAIRIESTPGEGTTISCELQIHGSDDDDQ